MTPDELEFIADQEMWARAQNFRPHADDTLRLIEIIRRLSTGKATDEPAENWYLGDDLSPYDAEQLQKVKAATSAP